MALARSFKASGTNTTFASTVTSGSFTSVVGDILIVTVEADVVNANGITVTDNKGNTWTRVRSTALAATFDLETWWCQVAVGKGGAGHTVTATDNGGGVDSIILVEEVSGQDTVSPQDKDAGATGTASTALNSGASAATTVANEIVYGLGVCSITTLTLGAGYTNLTTAATSFSRLGIESKIVSSTGAQTATMTAGASASWCMQVSTYKEAVVAGVSAKNVVPNQAVQRASFY